MRRVVLVTVLAVPGLVAALVCGLARAPQDTSAARWADEDTCVGCHRAEVEAWRDSHHALALQRPSPATVLGRFSAAGVGHGPHAFVARDGHYRIRTRAEGEVREFEVAHVIGVAPLQQYLVDTGDGRLQAFPVAWDTGRERWFDLPHTTTLTEHDPLHWRQPAHNANFMCLECHTTDFRRGHDPVRDRFASRWRQDGVGCQGCHGPAGGHLYWAWRPDDDPLRGFAAPVTAPAEQVEMCARCHAHRTPLGEPPPLPSLHEHYLVSGLEPELYEVDGTLLGEVFEYGSFMQSRMQRAGVTCSDCHDVHGARLLAQGDAVCTRCHNEAPAPRPGIDPSGLKAGRYDHPAHHHHAPGSPGAACRSCHMPGRTYMGNDRRHDHAFTSPDPAQALALRHDDACIDCHGVQQAGRLIAAFERWYPDHRPRDGGFARALFAARNGRQGAARALHAQLARDDLPALRRAALIETLPWYPSEAADSALREALTHASPLVRRAALAAAGGLLPPENALRALLAGLDDPVRSVRVSAAGLLIEADLPLPDAAQARALLAEYEAVQDDLRERADAWYNLAGVHRVTGRPERVRAALETALQRDPAHTPARVMLAEWLELTLGDTNAGRRVLQDGLARTPGDAALHHALGLALVRDGDLPGAIAALRRAHELAPGEAGYAQVLAIALHDTGRRAEAEALLAGFLDGQPQHRTLRLLLLDWLGWRGERAAALVEELRRQNPDDPVLRRTTARNEGENGG